jgi:glucose/arabinose dehydrogenase
VQPDDGQDHIFVTEQSGLVHVFPNDQQAANAQVFLDISDRVRVQHNEEGLLGLAFDPEYGTNGHLYVYYSAASPRRSVVSRFTVSQSDPNTADPDSELVVMEIPQPFGNHNGGQVAFGPDGYLYIGLGDGGAGGDPLGNGQDLSTLLASILRIDVRLASEGTRYGIPEDNPFVGIDGARDEIWAYGLRNPWRFSFDDETGLLWTGDVGQNRWEEVDVVEKGLNYGWNVTEGRHCFSPAVGCDTSGLEPPVAEYSRAEGCSITGGYVYRGHRIPSLQGAYVYGDFCSGKIWGLHYDGRTVADPTLLVDSNLSITSFGRDVAGNLYILSRDEGIYRLVGEQ